jgi:hypothetical protein
VLVHAPYRFALGQIIPTQKVTPMNGRMLMKCTVAEITEGIELPITKPAIVITSAENLATAR